MTPPLWIPGHAWQANSYLAGNILFDAGVTLDTIAPYKTQIDTIILTHGHYDHTAHAAEISAFCGADVYIGEYDLPYLTDSSLSLSAHFAAKQTECKARPLKDGDEFGDFRVYHTPGHTAGSICLFREDDGVLISGDTLFPDGSYGRCDLPTGNASDLKTSIDRI
ncbi:MAG: MBL fold metallo-hydrolase, partial [Methanocorpusculum sp.]|nr:MBL fold metallo-hydrolase [Methanocorpusculum sp.]